MKPRVAFIVPDRVGRFRLLTLAILLMILVRPLLEGWIGIRLLTDLLFFGIFLSGIFAARGDKFGYQTALLLSGGALAARTARHLDGVPILVLLSEGLTALFFAHALWNIREHIRTESKVTQDLIFAAICAYLLIGLLWAYAYYFLEQARPGSFKAAEAMVGDLWGFFYFSFVTLTSLGYGDIVAASRPARSLVIVEAVVGQLYLATLIGRLVGAYAAQFRGGDV